MIFHGFPLVSLIGVRIDTFFRLTPDDKVETPEQIVSSAKGVVFATGDSTPTITKAGEACGLHDKFF